MITKRRFINLETTVSSMLSPRNRLELVLVSDGLKQVSCPIVTSGEVPELIQALDGLYSRVIPLTGTILGLKTHLGEDPGIELVVSRDSASLDTFEETLALGLNKEGYKRQGELLGYPSCCIENFVKGSGAHDAFLRLLQKEGRSTREFVAVPYVPCRPSCEETVKRDYAGHIRRNHPVLYEELLHQL